MLRRSCVSFGLRALGCLGISNREAVLKKRKSSLGGTGTVQIDAVSKFDGMTAQSERVIEDAMVTAQARWKP